MTLQLEEDNLCNHCDDEAVEPNITSMLHASCVPRQNLSTAPQPDKPVSNSPQPRCRTRIDAVQHAAPSSSAQAFLPPTVGTNTVSA